MSRVVEYAKAFVGRHRPYQPVERADGRSLANRPAFCSSMPRTSIFFIGKAINPAHQNPDLPITFGIKIRLVRGAFRISGKMGKQIKVSYF